MLMFLWRLFVTGFPKEPTHVHKFKWHEYKYSNAIAQRGECTECGFQEEKVISWINDKNNPSGDDDDDDEIEDPASSEFTPSELETAQDIVDGKGHDNIVAFKPTVK